MLTVTPGALRELLRERGLTLEAVAVLGGVDTATVSRIINGHNRARPTTIVHLARALGISARRMKLCATTPGRPGRTAAGNDRPDRPAGPVA